MRYLWCGLCGSTAVLHPGDICVRCEGELTAIIHPDDRVPVRQARPLGLRFLFWLSGGRVA